jgi:hypothetical protein
MKTYHRNRAFACGVLACGLLAMTSCEYFGLETLNVNRTSLTSVEASMLLNNAVVMSRPQLANHHCESTIVKQHIRIVTGIGSCANFNVDARQATSFNWDNGYETRLRAVIDIINTVEDDPAQANLYNMARIWRAYTFMRITDSYGNVPYTDAALGHLEGRVFPTYDTQESIYTSSAGILEELASASAALDAGEDARPDALYDGDVTRWQRLGYSLLLRAAMRLSKVRPDLAEQYVATAVSGGLMQSNADNALIRHTSEYLNQPGQQLNANEGHNEYLPADFVDWMQENNDPRLAAIAVRYPTAVSAADHRPSNADRSPANQIGMPVGFDSNTILPVVQAAGLPSFFAYSQTDLTRMFHPEAPSFLVTFAQTQLLLAEAVHRGWAQGDAAALYESGIEAHMQQISTGYSGTEIAQADIDAYIQANPLVPGRELEQINTQYWMASFLIPDEVWANFRRSGYPDLTPNPLRGSLSGDERFMRRFGYPDAERSVNPNFRTGGVTPDEISTRVWWDVKE